MILRIIRGDDGNYRIRYVSEDPWCSQQPVLGTISLLEVHNRDRNYICTDVDYVEVVEMVFYKERGPEIEEEARNRES